MGRIFGHVDLLSAAFLGLGSNGDPSQHGLSNITLLDITLPESNVEYFSCSCAIIALRRIA